MLSHFALRLICGIGLMLAGIPRKTIASGFFRVQMLIVLGLSVLVCLANDAYVPRVPQGLGAGTFSPTNLLTARWFLGILLGLEAFVGSMLWTLERRPAATKLMFVLLGTSLLTLGTSTLLISPQPKVGLVFLLCSELSSTLLLGAALTGMLLGHSYLTTPTMSIAPLSRINLYLGAGALLRGIVSGTVLVIAWGSLQGPSYFVWLLLRWSAGIIAPLILSIMTHQILRYRNTQAATGVLFVGVIVTFIGELSGSLLSQEARFPV
ncbi:MAG: hypothetical protein U0903_10925 [Planctomycetales bacterium]